MRSQRATLVSLPTVFGLLFVVVFVWGLERWRHSAHSRAERTQGARLLSLSRCLLGADGLALARTPEAARQRLRALALATSNEPGPTWFDRCIPFADALVRHATELDDSNALTSTQTRVGESMRSLARDVKRVGLVWRIRTGDAESDMGPVADALGRALTELELAGTRFAQIAPNPDAPVAPSVRARPEGVLVHLAGSTAPVTGLEPQPAGSPSRFLVGAPLPMVAAVVRDEERGFHVETLANEPAHAWSTTGSAVLRIDAAPDAEDPGLALLRYIRPSGGPIGTLVTAVSSPLAGLHIALDGAQVGSIFWFVEWTAGGGTVLARVAPHSTLTALQLAPPTTVAGPAGDAPNARAANGNAPSIARDEHVAMLPLPRGAVAAYTLRDDGANVSHLVLRGVPVDRANAAVVDLGELSVQGHNPGIESCASPGVAPVLVVPGAREWLVLRVGDRGYERVFSYPAARGRTFDERAWVRCSPDGLVAYPRENALRGPLLACAPGGNACAAVDPPAGVESQTLPLYVTRTPNNRALAHGSWPRSFVRTSTGTLVAVRGAGPLVSFTRRAAGARSWGEEAVLFDAAERTHGVMIDGLEVYAEGRDVLVAASSSEGLRVFVSHDEGASFR